MQCTGQQVKTTQKLDSSTSSLVSGNALQKKNDLADEILNAKAAHEYINIQYIWIYINKFKSFINS